MVIPGGFGERGIEGKIAAAGYARENDVPCLGICLGLQVMTIEFARNVLRPGRRELDRDGPDDAAPGDRPDARPARRQRQGRHAAPRRVLRDPRRPARRSPRRTASRWSASGTATATSSTRSWKPGFEANGSALQRHLARQAAGRVHRARRPPVLGRHAGAPGVQEPPRPPAPAVPRARRRGARAARGTRRGRTSATPGRLRRRHRRPIARAPSSTVA